MIEARIDIATNEAADRFVWQVNIKAYTRTGEKTTFNDAKAAAKAAAAEMAAIIRQEAKWTETYE